MNKKKKVLVLTSFVVFLVIGVVKGNIIDDFLEFIGIIEADEKISEDNLITRDWSKDIYKNSDGTYSLILYSGIRNVVDIDGKWKRIEDAKSLMPAIEEGKIKINYLEKEKGLYIEIKEINYTYISFRPKSSKKRLVPVKIDNVNIGSIDTEPGSHLEVFAHKNFNDNIFLHNFTVGLHSTTIQLQAADTENLDDSSLVQTDPDETNYGASSNAYILSSTDADRYFISKWNITSIPDNMEITSSTIAFYLATNFLDAGESFNIIPYRVYGRDRYNISDVEWTEGTITWNNRPDSTAEYNNNNQSVITVDDGEGAGWQYLTVSQFVDDAYDDNDDNVTLMLVTLESVSSPESGDFLLIRPKEAAGSTTDPYLNITYQVPVQLKPINIQQWINVVDYNNTHIEYELNIWVQNNHTSQFTYIEVEPDSKHGEKYNISNLGSGSSNITILSNLTARLMTDTWHNITEANITDGTDGTFTPIGTSNEITMILPIDPPSALGKIPASGDWKIDCSYNITKEDENIIISGDIIIHGDGGSFYYKNVNLTYGSWINSATNCMIIKEPPYRNIGGN